MTKRIDEASIKICTHCDHADSACWCIQASCGHTIGPDADDLPPCEDCDQCEQCCRCEPED